MKIPLNIPDIPGVPREIVERVIRSGRPYCLKCRQDTRDHKQIVNAERELVTIEVTCGCGTITRNVPLPRRAPPNVP